MQFLFLIAIVFGQRISRISKVFIFEDIFNADFNVLLSTAAAPAAPAVKVSAFSISKTEAYNCYSENPINYNEINHRFYKNNPLKLDYSAEKKRLITTLRRLKIGLYAPPIKSSTIPNPLLREQSRNKLKETIFKKKRENCLYMTQDFWHYEYCHNHFIRQYIITEELGVIEYYLGYFMRNGRGDVDAKGLVFGVKGSELVEADADGTRFLRQFWGNGTHCDILGGPRYTQVQFHCCTRSHFARIQEISVCSYIAIIHTPFVCEKNNNPASSNVDNEEYHDDIFGQKSISIKCFKEKEGGLDVLDGGIDGGIHTKVLDEKKKISHLLNDENSITLIEYQRLECSSLQGCIDIKNDMKKELPVVDNQLRDDEFLKIEKKKVEEDLKKKMEEEEDKELESLSPNDNDDLKERDRKHDAVWEKVVNALRGKHDEIRKVLEIFDDDDEKE